jgi:hypothetical protein
MNYKNNLNQKNTKTSPIPSMLSNNAERTVQARKKRMGKKGTYSCHLYKMLHLLQLNALRRKQLETTINEFMKTLRCRIISKKVENQDCNAIFKFMSLTRNYDIMSFRESLLFIKK